MDEKGQWALIGSKSPKYLWILSRMPSLEDATLRHIIALAKAKGYDVLEMNGQLDSHYINWYEQKNENKKNDKNQDNNQDQNQDQNQDKDQQDQNKDQQNQDQNGDGNSSGSESSSSASDDQNQNDNIDDVHSGSLLCSGYIQ